MQYTSNPIDQGVYAKKPRLWRRKSELFLPLSEVYKHDKIHPKLSVYVAASAYSGPNAQRPSRAYPH
jgi:hypothetical protein